VPYLAQWILSIQLSLPGGNEMTKVIQDSGPDVDFDAAVNLMDDDICESLHAELNYSFTELTDQELFNAYCYAHKEKFNEDFIVN